MKLSIHKKLFRPAIAALFIAAQLPLALGGSAYALENNSDFKIELSTSSSSSVENETEVEIKNSTEQVAVTGDVELRNVKQAENITTGNASNENVTELAVAVDNQTDVDLPAQTPVSQQTGHHRSHSPDPSTVTNDVQNKTEIKIYNRTSQSAVTGSVELRDVKAVGNITTGDASNYNCTDLQLAVAAGSTLTKRAPSACAEESQPPIVPVVPVVPTVPESGQGGQVLGTTTTTTPTAVAATTSAPAQLANTGSEALIGLFAALNLIGITSALAYATRKNS